LSALLRKACEENLGADPEVDDLGEASGEDGEEPDPEWCDLVEVASVGTMFPAPPRPIE
jgi:hypothetical protein